MILTVFTPTYNRANLLNRVYSSLKRQKYRDFEWLIIDDGSVDNTEEIVAGMICEGEISINYIKKGNGGKHTAHNLAIEHAQGDLFVCLDSDDYFTDDAIDAIYRNISKLHSMDCGLVAYKKDVNGKILSTFFPKGLEQHLGLYGYLKQYSLSGEYVLVFKTSILRKYPYPVIEGEYFIGENVLYDRLEMSGYTLYPVGQVIEVCEYQDNGLSNNFYRLLCNNPAGYAIYHAQRINIAKTFKEKLRHGISYNAFFRIAKKNRKTVTPEVNFITILTWLPGQLGAVYYIIKSAVASHSSLLG